MCKVFNFQMKEIIFSQEMAKKDEKSHHAGLGLFPIFGAYSG